jgi:hypothetical protein
MEYWWNDTDRKNCSTRGKLCASGTLSTTRTGLALNPCLFLCILCIAFCLQTSTGMKGQKHSHFLTDCTAFCRNVLCSPLFCSNIPKLRNKEFPSPLKFLHIADSVRCLCDSAQMVHIFECMVLGVQRVIFV